MLELSHVSKTFNAGTVNEKRALCDLSLTLADGEFATIVGSNGAGKSTLVTCINRINTPGSGTVLLDGEDIASRSTYRPVQVYAADINSDGVIELPCAVLISGEISPRGISKPTGQRAGMGTP